MGLYIDVFDNVITYEEMFPLIKKVGFDGFFTGHEYANDLEKITKYNSLAKEYGLKQETSHSTIPYCECIWMDNSAGDNYKNVLLNNIKNCKAVGVDTLVVHVQTQNNADLEMGINRFREVVKYAKESGIKLAFENINNPAFLYETLSVFTESHIGFCYDCGHEACFSLGENYLTKIGDRLLCTHLHDNDLENDNHFIPFDGKIDFEKVVSQLKNCNYKGNLTLELSYRNAASGMPYEEFFKKAFCAATKLKELIF